MGERADSPDAGVVTQLLLQWRAGDAAALDRLMPLVYAELRQLAERHMRGERPGHTLQPTAVLHEAFLRLVHSQRVDWQGRAHFLAAMAGIVRRVLVDHARRKHAVKRGAHGQAVPFDETLMVTVDRPRPLVALDDALEAFARVDPRRAHEVELKFFGGLEVNEIAELLDLSPGTVKRDLGLAKAWLVRELSSTEGSST
jgi:RNA polymerase sigma factor (TIGR02999 family)